MHDSKIAHFEFTCTNVTNGEIFNLFKFNQNATKANYTEVTTYFCPISVAELIRDLIINKSHKTSLKIATNGLIALPANLLNNQTSLESLDVIGWNISSLSTNIFSGLTKLEKLKVHETIVMELPVDIFTDLSELKWLELDEN